VPDAPGGFGVTEASEVPAAGWADCAASRPSTRTGSWPAWRTARFPAHRALRASQRGGGFRAFDGHSLGAGLTKIGVPCVLFLAAAGAVEWYRRRGSSAATHVDQAMLVADSLFLVAVTLPGGGVRSPWSACS